MQRLARPAGVRALWDGVDGLAVRRPLSGHANPRIAATALLACATGHIASEAVPDTIADVERALKQLAGTPRSPPRIDRLESAGARWSWCSTRSI